MSRKNDRARKQEIAEKVKEIQMRQKRWLQQRDEHLNGKEVVSEIDTKASKKENALSTKSKPEIVKSGIQETSKHKGGNFASPGVQPKGKFKQWMEVRETRKSGREDVELNEDGHDVNILRVPSSRSPGFASPEPYHNEATRAGKTYKAKSDHYISYSERSGREAVDSLLSPQDFNALADSIVARVKQDMNIHPGQPSDSCQQRSKDFTRKSYNRPVDVPRDKKGHREVNTSSHHCPCCHKLMMPPEHAPLINIPCGHSVCQQCCEMSQLCPSCDCHVTSKTCNMMLLQIIQDFHRKELGKREVTHEAKSYSPENYDERLAYSKDLQSYKEQHENLIARQDVMLAEADSVKSNMAELSRKIQKQQQQVHNIAQEETKLKKQIKTLEEKVQALASHREEYSREQDALQKKHNTEANRLNMIKETLLTLDIEIEKVQLLAEGR